MEGKNVREEGAGGGGMGCIAYSQPSPGLLEALWVVLPKRGDPRGDLKRRLISCSAL